MSTMQIRLMVVVDVVGALAADTLEDAVWLMDSNKTGGSTNQGTRQLTTAVRQGDQLIWTAMSLECEAFIAIDGIDIDQEYCEVRRGIYEGTDISYWMGRIKKDPEKALVPYNLRFRVGGRSSVMSLPGPNLPAIIGGRT